MTAEAQGIRTVIVADEHGSEILKIDERARWERIEPASQDENFEGFNQKRVKKQKPSEATAKKGYFVSDIT